MPEALTQLAAEEQAKLVDMESVGKTAVRRVEQSGIIFIDEIDKIASRDGGHGGHGPDVSREGVQRDILPIVEGTTVNTKHGFVRTDHILFIAAGAFHVSKPSDLIPELQGRFPIRVELDALTRDDFVRILTEPRGSLVKQYTALLGAEDVTADLHARRGGADRRLRRRVNDHAENIGARRLHTVMERLLDELSFDAPELRDTASRHRRRLRGAHAGGHRDERGSVEIHPLGLQSPVYGLQSAVPPQLAKPAVRMPDLPSSD